MATAKKEVVPKASSEIGAAEDLWGGDAGAGYEETDVDAYALPILSVLQKMSPQVDEADGAYVEGAKPGKFFDNVDGKVFDAVTVVPVHYRRSVIEWIPRDDGGGLVGEMTPEDAERILGVPITARNIRNDKGKIVVQETGHELQDTRQHYVLVITDEGIFPAMLSLTSTQLKKSRRWMTAMSQVTFRRADGTRYRPPMWAHVYRLMTVPESNDKGSWHGLTIERSGSVDEVFGDRTPEIVDAAKGLREAVLSGRVRVKQDEPSPEVDDDIGF